MNMLPTLRQLVLYELYDSQGSPFYFLSLQYNELYLQKISVLVGYSFHSGKVPKLVLSNVVFPRISSTTHEKEETVQSSCMNNKQCNLVHSSFQFTYSNSLWSNNIHFSTPTTVGITIHRRKKTL